MITIMILIFTEHLLCARHHAQHSYSSSHSLFVQENRSTRAHGTFWENCKEFSMAGTDHVNGATSFESGVVREQYFEGVVYHAEEVLLDRVAIENI